MSKKRWKYNVVALVLVCFCFGIANAQVSYRANIKAAVTDSLIFPEMLIQDAFLEPLDSIYRQRDFNPLFSRGLASMYLNYLEEITPWGFDKNQYLFEELDTLAKQQNPKAKAAFDILASQSYLLLLEDVLNGLLKNESTRGAKIHFALQKINLFEALEHISQGPSLNYLRLAEPNIQSYQESKNLLAKYYNNAKSFPSEAFIYVDTLQLGDRDSSVQLLREKLYFLGDLTQVHRLRSQIFDHDVVLALSNFQERNLLPVTGLLDQKTASRLAIDLEDLLAELQINLERWRWLPNFLGSYYAFANLAAFEMEIVKNDSLLLRQKIVCGKPTRNTPSFMDTMVYIDINPTWTVPPTILQNDILPAAKRNSSYLSNKNIKVLNVQTGKYISSAEINWANAKSYKFIQGPGLSNSLGVVKFIFPNDYYIFFHDTPHKEHFPYASRAYSSGCVRLAQPLELAELLLSFNTQSYSLTEIDSIVETQVTKRVLLQEKPAVYIQYITQEFKDGLFYQYPDIYKYNEELKKNFFKKAKELKL